MAIKTTHLSDQHVSVGWGTKAIATATTRPGTCASPTLTADSDRQIRFTPPFAFEVEEFDSQIPEENWRYRQGVPQTLDFPSIRS
jgi:hypothetical protein